MASNQIIHDSFYTSDNYKMLASFLLDISIPPRQIKLNFYGVAKDGVTSGCGVVQDYGSNIILAFYGNFDLNYSNMEEILSLYLGLKLITSMERNTVMVEGDCQLIMKVTNQKMIVGWLVLSVLNDGCPILAHLEKIEI